MVFSRDSKNKGFGMLEMLIVVVVLGILGSVLFPRFMGSSSEGQIKSSHRATRQTINAQLELFFFQNNVFPVNGQLTEWVNDVGEYFPEGVPTSCNVQQMWVVDNGRVNTIQHEEHE